MNTLITTHKHVDFDALASTVAAQKLYLNADILLPHSLGNNVRSFLNLYRDFLPLVNTEEASSKEYQRLIIVDTGEKNRLPTSCDHWIDGQVEVHRYDHHTEQQSDLMVDVAYVEPVGATTTLLVEELKRVKIELEDWEATLLVMGIFEDTGNLLFKSTTVRDVEAINYLWKIGIKVEMLHEFLQHSLTAPQKTLLERLISQTEFYEINQRKVLISRASFDGYVQGVGELVHRISDLGETELTICLVEMEGKVLLIARAYQEDINLLDLLQDWGVKGHSSAVSVTFRENMLSRVRSGLIKTLEQTLNFPLRAEAISSSPVNTIEVNTKVSEAMDKLTRLGHSGFPVMDDKKRLVGIVSRKDLEKARRSNLEHAPVKAFMSNKLVYAHPQDSVSYLRNLMVLYNVGRIPLLNEKEEITGIVTRSDIMKALYRVTRNREKSLNETAVDNQADYRRQEVYSKNLTSIDDLTEIINRNLPQEMQRVLWLISQNAEKENASVYLVGGSIRDLLLGVPVSKDLDLVVLPEAIAFARKLNSFLKGKLKVFEPFGTASLFLRSGLRLDLVTARKEFYAAPGQLPQVEVSSLKADLFRRDFSINTLACSLNNQNFGKVYDFFGGREDLQRGIIRSLYHLSFVDDPLRILRAVRFEQRFNFFLEEDTSKQLKNALKKRLLDKVSRDRLNGELRLVFQEKDPVATLKRLYSLGILTRVFPCLKPNYKTWWRLYRVKEILAWSRRREWDKYPDEELVYLAALHYDYSHQELYMLGRRMRYSRSRIEKLVTCCKAVPEALEILKKEGVRNSTVYHTFNPLPDEALLLLMAVTDDPKIKDYPRLFWDSLKKVHPTLRGHHLKQMGFQPGPLLGQALEELKDAILDGKVRTVEEEKEMVLTYLAQSENNGERRT